METCAIGSQELVDELLARGADPRRTDSCGKSALHHLCYWSDIQPYSGGNETSCIPAIGKALLAHGADPDLPDENGMTPLMMACEVQFHDLAEELLSSGADPAKTDVDDRTALHLLCSNESDELGLMTSMGSTLLRHGADPNAADLRGVTPLMRACLTAHRDTVVELLSSGAVVNKTDECGDTALHYLRWSDSIHPVASTGSALLHHGADSNAVNAKGVTPLMEACEAQLHELVDVLLSHGADPSKGDEEDKTALHYLCERNEEDTQDNLVTSTGSALLRHGADPNAADLRGATPLIKACSKAFHGLVAVLLTNGADPAIGDKNNLTALHGLCWSRCGSSDKTSTGSALLRHGADPNATDVRGVTPLMEACREGLHDLVIDLLAYGAEPNRRDGSGQVALHFLCLSRSARAAPTPALIASMGSALLRHGADPNVASSTGLTPLMEACRLVIRDLVVLLLSKGADPTSKYKDGRTAFDYVPNRSAAHEFVDDMGIIESTYVTLLKSGAKLNEECRKSILATGNIKDKLELVDVAIQTGHFSRDEVEGIRKRVEEIEEEDEDDVNALKVYMKEFVETGFI